jgi:hypothetical protein
MGERGRKIGSLASPVKVNRHRAQATFAAHTLALCGPLAARGRVCSRRPGLTIGRGCRRHLIHPQMTQISQKKRTRALEIQCKAGYRPQIRFLRFDPRHLRSDPAAI